MTVYFDLVAMACQETFRHHDKCNLLPTKATINLIFSSGEMHASVKRIVLTMFTGVSALEHAPHVNTS